jgi:aryl-phospho-beta-D-glucosidase BglC (GH1 family)
MSIRNFKRSNDIPHARLVQHWNTFYTEKDFKEIAGWGINLVRIPIGYWACLFLNNTSRRKCGALYSNSFKVS